MEQIQVIQRHFGSDNAFIDGVQYVAPDLDADAIEKDMKRLRWFVLPASLLYIFIMALYLGVLLRAL